MLGSVEEPSMGLLSITPRDKDGNPIAASLFTPLTGTPYCYYQHNIAPGSHTLNAKAGIYAMQEVMQRTGKDIPLMLSATVNDTSGRLLSGQTLEAFLISVSHAPLLSIGLNWSFGTGQMLPVLRNLHRMLTERGGESGQRPFISCHPNAGLPNSMGQYDVTPEQFAQSVSPMLDERLVDIIGGCCGTTPEHIKAVVDLCR